MRTVSLAIFLLCFFGLTCHAEEHLPAAQISAVRQSCRADCRDFDAVIFVHGIYGDETTFKNGAFDWPNEFAQELGGRKIDVFRINYKTAMFAWLRSNIATFDDVVQTLYDSMYGSDERGTGPSPLITNGYRSIGFIAHSLGGNLATAYLHTVKTWRGHNERPRYSFVITLGTPVNAAQIANLALVAKWILGMNDPLLSALTSDNTFLRMLTYWKRAETSKAESFGCRRVALYVGLEGAWMAGMSIVDSTSALAPLAGLQFHSRMFADYNHEQLAKPANRSDPIFQWVNDSVEA